jgi:outer membrane receptor protein involved in Fe transport
MRGSIIRIFFAGTILGAAALAGTPTYGDQAQNTGGSAGAPQTSSTNSGGVNSSLEEIVVTAQKRSEKLIDVPASVGVMSGDHLTLLQSNSLADMASYVPGLTVQNGGAPGENMLVIRGLSTGYNNVSSPALVGTYIDGMQIGSSTAGTRGAVFGLDLMPYDVAQIEVLRGPQGTLYGGDAMAGLVKYELRKPDLTQFEAQVGTDVEDITGSGKPGWGGRAAVNMPIVTDVLGLRLSGFYKDTAGYIDNVGIGVKDSNHSKETGGRATLLWKPTDDLSVQLTILGQDIDSAGPTAVTLNEATLRPVYGADSRLTLLPEPYTQELRDYGLNIDWDLGFATLNSNSSWQQFNNQARYDLTPNFGKYIPVAGALADEQLSDDFSKFTQEIRLSSPDKSRGIQWIVGGYYTHEDGDQIENVPTFTPQYVPLPTEDNLLYDNASYIYQEMAAFANLTYKFTERFDVSAGDRYSINKQSGCTAQTTGLFGGTPGSCSGRPSQDVSTWMTNARFHLDPDTMFYARVATGYRPGGGCDSCGNPKLGTPDFFYPDRTTNYEVGFKSEAFDHRLQIDTSIFYIDWTNIQLQQLTNLGILYTGNGGTASSSGIELTTSYKLTQDLRLTATLDHTDAHLTEDAPGAGGHTGDQLPNSPRWSGSLMADYTHDLFDNSSFIAGGGYRYRDKVVSQFAGTENPEPMGPQDIVDVYAGVVWQQATFRLYVKNVFDNQSYTGLFYLTNPKLPQFVPVQPRTIGLSMDYKF